MEHSDLLDSFGYDCLSSEEIKAWEMAFDYEIPYDLAIHICRRTNDFSFGVLYCTDRSVYNALSACIAEEWGEGIVIMEQEIAHRGLHVENNEGRFEL